MGLDPGASAERGDYRAIDHRLAELLDHIEDQRGLAGPIDVQKTGERFESGVHDRAPDLRIEHAVAIIERGVDGIGGTAMLLAPNRRPREAAAGRRSSIPTSDEPSIDSNVSRASSIFGSRCAWHRRGLLRSLLQAYSVHQRSANSIP